MPIDKEDITEYAISSLSNIISFAEFVNYAEDLYQRDEMFNSEETKKIFQQRWFELEIINALALSEWDAEGRPADWHIRWEADYKKEASGLISELLHTLK